MGMSIGQIVINILLQVLSHELLLLAVSGHDSLFLGFLSSLVSNAARQLLLLRRRQRWGGLGQ